MKSIFMRVLFCKIHCPSFICFCKPSTATHLYNSGTLKLEDTPHAPHPLVETDRSDQDHVEDVVEVKEKDISEDAKQEPEIEVTVLRSCMKNKGNLQSGSPIDRKKVQWIDNFGKELVDIREFESSETGDTDNEDENSACFCSIL
ncbi:hypothetical protein QVD17_01002 [Tagetes erecta]|uniref:Uncharacterized protein n=1 Tax=Tagetes erecta TaxID=13708 RepID=A0AAD8P7Y1_TARER|nr:hypothetical protein QVD17_01002 [Tagetes erecta]